MTSQPKQFRETCPFESSDMLNNEEQTKSQMPTLGKEMKNLRSELQEPS